jgi:hypothetical protein
VVWLKRSLLVILVFAAIGFPVSAQAQGGQRSLGTVLTPGMTVWITERDGREQKARIVGVTADVIAAMAGEELRRFPVGDISRVRARRSDTLINGAPGDDHLRSPTGRGAAERNADRRSSDSGTADLVRLLTSYLRS